MEPAVGMGASITLWSDRRPVTVIKVNTFKSGPRKGLACSVVVQPDSYGPSLESGSGKYEFTANPRAEKITFIRNVNNVWVRRGRGGRANTLLIGRREVRFDERVQSLVNMR